MFCNKFRGYSMGHLEQHLIFYPVWIFPTAFPSVLLTHWHHVGLLYKQLSEKPPVTMQNSLSSPSWATYNICFFWLHAPYKKDNIITDSDVLSLQYTTLLHCNALEQMGNSHFLLSIVNSQDGPQGATRRLYMYSESSLVLAWRSDHTVWVQ